MVRWLLNVRELLIVTAMMTSSYAVKLASDSAKSASSADDYYDALSPAVKGASSAAKLTSSASDYYDSAVKDAPLAVDGNDAKSSSSSDYYQTDVDPTSGLDENGENYIPFQWGVEIIKREYDDYVLPDGTTYRVPKGAIPPYRYKGPGPYKVPYSVFKSPEGHSDRTYNGKPKLVETWDKQLLELLMQSWYENAYWDRYRPARQMAGDDYYYPAATEEKTNKNRNNADDHYYMTRFENKNRYRR